MPCREHTAIFVIHSYIPYTNALMNAAEGFKNHQSSILYKLLQAGNQEEIIEQHCLAFMQLLASSIKVKVDVQMLNELCDRVSVGVRFL